MSPEMPPPGMGKRLSHEGDLQEQNLLLGVAMETWRMLRAARRLADMDAPPALRMILAAVRRQADAFQQAGLVWEEYNQQPYDIGMNVEVLHYEPTPSLPAGKRVVKETVRPGIKLHGRLVQPAQVIVAKGQA